MAMTMSGEQQLAASRETVWKALNDPAILKACIPGCETLDTRSHQPTLLLLAGKDDWTPPADCLLAGASMKDEGRPVSIVLYPEASHLYDAPGPMRDYLGHRIGFDASATRDSRLQVSRFLAREFVAR